MHTFRYKLLAAVLLWCATALTARADNDALFQKTLHSTGWIEVPGRGNGTCVVVDVEQRLVLTNFHVVYDKDDCIVRFAMYQHGELVRDVPAYLKAGDAVAIQGKVIARDAARDLALVQLERLPAGVTAIPLAAKTAAPGTPLMSFGHSDENAKQFADVKLWRTRTGQVTFNHFYWPKEFSVRDIHFQFEAVVLISDVRTRPGDSGGPMVNPEGELVALTSHGNFTTSYAVDISEIRFFLDRALHGATKHAPGDLTGAWILSGEQDGQRLQIKLTLNADGTFAYETIMGGAHGTYTHKDGTLILQVDMGDGTTAVVKLTAMWSGDGALSLQGIFGNLSGKRA